MHTSICLLSCALMLAQPGGDRADWQLTPQIAPGLELIYRGEFMDEVLGQNFERQTRYRLDANLLVLEAGVKDWRVAFLTSLRLHDGSDPLAKKLPIIPVAAPKEKVNDGPTSLRLELAQVELQGRIRNRDKRLVQIPLKGPPTLECGFLVTVPLTKVGRNYTWEVPEEGRPLMRWQVVGMESSGGISCIKVVGEQKTEDWDRARADQVAWRRRDIVWLHPQLNVAQKVERIIERRDPAREHPTERVSVRYELESHLRYPNILFQERMQEMLKASETYDTTQMLIKEPAQNRTQIDIQLQRLTGHLDRAQNSAYRHVFVHLKSILENAKKGEIPVPHVAEEPAHLPMRGLGIGHRAPDFVLSALTQEHATQFKAKHGKPTLVFFYNPATELGKELLAYAKRLSERNGPPVMILAMAVAPNGDAVRKQHQDLRLTFPIHDGNGMRLTFGVEQTPRIVVIDSDGLVSFTQTGWGIPTPFELDDVLQKCQKKE